MSERDTPALPAKTKERITHVPVEDGEFVDGVKVEKPLPPTATPTPTQPED